MRFQFIADHVAAFSVQVMCRVLQVSRSGYYAWSHRPMNARKMANHTLVEQIKQVHAASYATYGSPRVYHELKAQGVVCSENRVARLMQQTGLCARQVKRYRTTTRANPAHPVAPNLVAQRFSATYPNETWLTDISFIPTQEGWLYLAAILDLFSRRIVGWAMAPQMTSTLVTTALQMAVQHRQPPAGLLHHSDRGSQYTAQPYQNLLQHHQMQLSMSRTANCYDNAPMESFFGTLKREWVHHRRYTTRAEAKTDLFFYIETFYNRRRRHSSLGYRSPAAFEDAYHQHSTLSLCPPN